MKGQEPAFPTEVGFEKGVPVEAFQTGNNTAQYPGMTKLFYAACAAKDDFDHFLMDWQIEIVGEEPYAKTLQEMIQWKVRGRAKWRFIQAQAMLEEEEERLIKTE